LYATRLPALHRLLFSIINNIVPYSLFINLIIKGHGINLLDVVAEKLWISTNLFDELPNLG
jgi:hypothetical protein